MKIFNLSCYILVYVFFVVPFAGAATEAQAAAIITEYEDAQKLWLAEMKLAPNAASLQMIRKKQPDAAAYGKRLKRLLNRDLDKQWTLKYGAWLLENDTSLTASSQRALLNALEKNHIKSPQLGSFVMAMVYLRQNNEPMRAGKIPLRSRGMQLLEKIKITNPDPKVQGQAALSLALILSSLGEGGQVMRQRLANLREAVKKSADVKVGNTVVADIVKDQLYIITRLSNGREAPNLIGGDSAGRVVNLRDYQGKVILLVFWSSFDTDLARMDKALKILRRMNQINAEKPFAILGVNRDSLENLRALEADRIVTWRNISDPEGKIAKAYRIGSWPHCIVLDQDGVIRYGGAIGSFADAVVTDMLRSKPAVKTP